MLYLVNRYRFLTQTPEEAAGFLAEIEAASRLEATAVVNSSNLAAETTAQTVNDTAEFAEKTAALAGLPLYTVAERSVADRIAADAETVLPVERLVRTVWEK